MFYWAFCKTCYFLLLILDQAKTKYFANFEFTMYITLFLKIMINFCRPYAIAVHINIFLKKKLVKFIYYEKATKFCEISTVDLSYVLPVKSTLEILQNCGLLRIYELQIFTSAPSKSQKLKALLQVYSKMISFVNREWKIYFILHRKILKG